MSSFAFFGAVELGLVYAFVAMGVYLSFRVLDFPDLTVEELPRIRHADRERLERRRSMGGAHLFDRRGEAFH